ncbi:MAG: hypothetical protein JSS30_00865 [Verrucomicrobia bacterium]|nr:hypothetical protein [Verrucomicrobiota bacterium]
MQSHQDHSDHIAIIGLSGQFPQSRSIDEFWENLRNNRELISFFEKDHHSVRDLPEELFNNPNYVFAKGILENSCQFDNELFSYSIRESELMDPQARKFLMWSWEALENGGYDPDQYDGLIGVFACCSISSYLFFNLFPHLRMQSKASSDEMLAVLGCDKDFLATRVSYQLGLKGPSKTVQTACSSSLVAIHDACQSLLNYECDMALAGGVSITFPEKGGYLYVKEGINSKDGRCRPFDSQSSGTVSGNGGGIVLLKRAADALEHGDTIRGFIVGTAINNDGRDKVGFTAPSVKGQAQVIAQAISNAGITPNEIIYVEAHGTGTQLGDPIEIEALNAAFAPSWDYSKRCSIGSVKANIGHLDAAAGVAGLIKAVLCLENRLLPPLKHFQTPNRQIDFSSTPFSPLREAQLISDLNKPIYAGVSSFGIGGTNAHAILQAAPKVHSREEGDQWNCFPFSAFCPETLNNLLKRFITFLKKTDACLSDIGFTLRVGRRQLGTRVIFHSKSKADLLFQIESYFENRGLSDTPVIPNFLREIGNRWSLGEKIIWGEYDLPLGKRIPLPNYPFKCKNFYIEPLIHKKSPVLIPNEEKKTFNGEIERIWCEVLKIKSASEEDNFFAFGGDSLLALELCDLIRQSFFIDVSIKSLLESPTLGHLQKHASELLFETLEELDEIQLNRIQEFV